MKKFSVEVDREFEIGGELFKWRQPYWEDYANLLDNDIAAAQAAVDAATRTNGGETPEGETAQNDTVHAAIEDFIKRIEMFLDPENDSLKRWRALAKRKADPIATYQFRELHNWLVEVTSGRPPTEPPSPNGPEPTEPTSKDASS